MAVEESKSKKTASGKTAARKKTSGKTSGRAKTASGKKTTRKKSPRRKRPKVKLDSKSVTFLAITIICVCAVILSVSSLFAGRNVAENGTKKPETRVEKSIEKKFIQDEVSELAGKKESSAKKSAVSHDDIKKADEKKVSKAEKKRAVEKKSATSEKKSDNVRNVNAEKKSGNVKKEAERKREKPKAEKKQEKKESKTVKFEKIPEDDKKHVSKAEKTKPRVSENKPVQKKASQENVQKPVKNETQPKVASVNVQKPVPEKKTPVKSSFGIPKAKNGATLMFVIDDAGYSVPNVKEYTSVPFPITIAVMPRLPHSRDCAYVVRQSGKELILHQPMQAMNLKINPGAGAVLPSMEMGEIYQVVSENLKELGYGVKGINNHEGSLITSDGMRIGSVLDVVFDNRLYYLDSRTTAESKVMQAALERDMSIHQRDVFIDDVVSRDEMLKQIFRGIDIANKNGKAIMIGHVDKSVKILPLLFKELYPEFRNQGYRLATPGTY